MGNSVHHSWGHGERRGGPVRRACIHQPAASFSRAGTQLQHEVGPDDSGEVMLDHDYGVSGVPQPLQQVEQPIDVARVEADGWFVEHIERIDQIRTQRVGQRDPLRFAARERTSQPVQRQIAEPHVAQVLQAAVELIHDQVGHFAFEIRKGQLVQPGVQLIDRLRGDTRDHGASDFDAKRLVVEPGSVADRAGVGQLIPAEKHPDVLLVTLLLEALEERKDSHVAAVFPVEQLSLLIRLECRPGLFRIDTQGPRRVGEQPPAGLVAGFGPRIERTLAQAERIVGYDQRFVVLQHRPEAVASGAGAPGIVERKERGRDGHRGGIALAAGRVLGEAKPSLVVQHEGDAFAFAKRQGERLGQPAQRLVHGQPVHDHEQLTVSGQINRFGQCL